MLQVTCALSGFLNHTKISLCNICNMRTRRKHEGGICILTIFCYLFSLLFCIQYALDCTLAFHSIAHCMHCTPPFLTKTSKPKLLVLSKMQTQNLLWKWPITHSSESWHCHEKVTAWHSWTDDNNDKPDSNSMIHKHLTSVHFRRNKCVWD